MALEGPEEREICEQMREEIKERLEGQFFSDASLTQVFMSYLIPYKLYQSFAMTHSFMKTLKRKPKTERNCGTIKQLILIWT